MWVALCVTVGHDINILWGEGGRQTYLGVSCLGGEDSFCYAPIVLNNSASSCQMVCSLCISCAGGGGHADVLFLLTACSVRREQLCKN
jgi:hypothetical protein